MKLYGFPPSPNTWQVSALAAHIGLPVEFEFVDLTKGASRLPGFLAINPTGRTPALVDGDFTLWEATAIMQYVAGQTKSSLWPDDARSRADIMRWQSWALAHWVREAWSPLLTERFVKQIENRGPPDEAVVAAALQSFNKETAMLDAHLATRKYLVGDTLTIADFAVAAPMLYGKQADAPLGPYPQVRAWFERVAALPCWSKTAPQLPVAA